MKKFILPLLSFVMILCGVFLCTGCFEFDPDANKIKGKIDIVGTNEALLSIDYEATRNLEKEYVSNYSDPDVEYVYRYEYTYEKGETYNLELPIKYYYGWDIVSPYVYYEVTDKDGNALPDEMYSIENVKNPSGDEIDYQYVLTLNIDNPQGDYQIFVSEAEKIYKKVKITTLMDFDTTPNELETDEETAVRDIAYNINIYSAKAPKNQAGEYAYEYDGNVITYNPDFHLLSGTDDLSNQDYIISEPGTPLEDSVVKIDRDYFVNIDLTQNDNYFYVRFTRQRTIDFPDATSTTYGYRPNYNPFIIRPYDDMVAANLRRDIFTYACSYTKKSFYDGSTYTDYAKFFGEFVTVDGEGMYRVSLNRTNYYGMDFDSEIVFDFTYKNLLGSLPAIEIDRYYKYHPITRRFTYLDAYSRQVYVFDINGYTREDLDNYYLSYNDGEPIRKSYWQSLIYRIQLVEVYHVGGAYSIEDRTQLAEMSANLDVKFKCGDYDISPTYNSVHNHWDFQFHLFAAPYMYMGDSRYEAFNQDSNSISFWFQVESITAKS